MRMRFLAGLLLIALPYSTARNAAPPPSAEPQLWWDAPCGARQGSRFDVEVPGKTLAGAMAAWFDCSELRATIRKVEEVTPEPPPGAPARKERTEEGPRPEAPGCSTSRSTALRSSGFTSSGWLWLAGPSRRGAVRG